MKNTLNIALGVLMVTVCAARAFAAQEPQPADQTRAQIEALERQLQESREKLRQTERELQNRMEALAREQQERAEQVQREKIEQGVKELQARTQQQREEIARQQSARIPLQVQVVLSRYRGDKQLSSMPYVLAVNATPPSSAPLGTNEPARLRMGARVPVPSLQPTNPQSTDKAFTPPVSPVTYEDIGTNIDARARQLLDGAFELSISLEDKSVYANDDPTAKPLGGAPVFRTFQSSNTLVLRDGESRQFTAATDRVNGEVMRVEVTLTVVK